MILQKRHVQRFRCAAFGALAGLICTCFAGMVVAEEPPSAPKPMQANALLPVLLRSVEREFNEHLQVTLFRDPETGEWATLQVTPALPGCKLGLTYKF